MKRLFLLAALILSLTTMVNAESRYSKMANKKPVKTEYQLRVEQRNKSARKRYAAFKPISNNQVHKNLAKARARIAKNTSLSRNSRGYQAQVAMRKR